MAEVVVDASAILAIVHGEPGAEKVRGAVAGALMSAVNHAEVLRHLIDHGVPLSEAVHLTRVLGYEVAPAGADQAETIATLHDRTRRLGVSLGDQFCLALAMRLKLPVLTTDRRWAELDLGVEVRLIR